ncbi:MAG: SiaB family protein kinase [Flavobacteriaceae bacterium]|nr:SiaB family protein kinase [Flavobacteriaceae bacterium]PCJ26310.1 MAG: hypothetical protein COA97_05885 [Flavobacteriales bacterium]
MIDEKSLLIYKGEFNVSIVDVLLSNVKRKINKEIENTQNRKRFYQIIVECIENLNRHTRLNDEGERFNDFTSLFYLQKTPNALTTITGNLITKKEKEVLEKNLEEVLSHDITEIKKAYRKQLLTGEITTKGGAGVGLYDIAIKSNKNISYQFYPVDNNVFFYLLKVELKTN